MLTVYYARGGDMAGRWGGAILSTAALALVIAAAYVLNDVFDYQVDRAHPGAHPIAAGRVSRRGAGDLAIALLLAGLGLGALCRWQFLAVLAAVACGLVAYDVFSKRLGPAKQLAVAALTTSIYPLALAQAGGARGPRVATLPAFAVWFFLTSFGYEILKDIRDSESDPPVAGRATPIQRRRALWRAIAAVVIAASSLLLVGPFLLGCGWPYMAIAGCAIPLALAAGFAGVRAAIRLTYAECFIVGLAAGIDVMVLGS